MSDAFIGDLEKVFSMLGTQFDKEINVLDLVHFFSTFGDKNLVFFCKYFTYLYLFKDSF